MIKDKLRWGICGTGRISEKFVEDLRHVPGTEPYAIASRQITRARSFQKRMDMATAYGDYASMADDPNVDVIYVATPPHRHRDDVEICLQAGKPVLCEKPLAIAVEDIEFMSALARSKGVFLMEAMWMRFLPLHIEIRDRLLDSRSAEILSLTAQYGYRVPTTSASRLRSGDPGSGSLYDLGVYPVSFAHSILGAPRIVQAISSFDGPKSQTWESRTEILMAFNNGATASLLSSIEAEYLSNAEVVTDSDILTITGPFHQSRELTIQTGKCKKKLSFDYPGRGLYFQVTEVQRCLTAGLKESPIMPLKESYAVLQTISLAKSAGANKRPET